MFRTPGSRAKPVSAKLPVGSLFGCGRLTVLSTTALRYLPFSGNLIKINGQFYQIPLLGIAGLANTSVFVNGVANTNLSASTLYYVYAFINGGIITADFSTTIYANSAAPNNIGTVIKTGDDTRSLIGTTFTNASSQFIDGQTASWFNRRLKFSVTTISSNSTISSTTFTEFSSAWRSTFVTWGDEAVHAQFTGTAFLTVAGDNAITALSFDGTTPVDTGVAQSNATTALTGAVANGTSFLSDGNHYATVIGKELTGTGGLTIAGSSVSGQRGAVTVWFRG